MKPLQRHSNGQFQKGSGGRQVGSRNKLHGDFFDALTKHWAEVGSAAIDIVRSRNRRRLLEDCRKQSCRRNSSSESELDKMTDDELIEALRSSGRRRRRMATTLHDRGAKPEALEALERRLLDVQERRQVRKSWLPGPATRALSRRRIIC